MRMFLLLDSFAWFAKVICTIIFYITAYSSYNFEPAIFNHGGDEITEKIPISY